MKNPEDERCWWVARYIMMSKEEIRRANNGGKRKGNYKRKRKRDQS